MSHINGVDFNDPTEVIACFTTDDLIAELERRRPCERCKFKLCAPCLSCIWRDVWDAAGNNNHEDKFKEAK